MWTGARSRVSAATGVLSWFSFSGGILSLSTTMARSQCAFTAHEASRVPRHVSCRQRICIPPPPPSVPPLAPSLCHAPCYPRPPHAPSYTPQPLPAPPHHALPPDPLHPVHATAHGILPRHIVIYLL